MLIRAHGVPRSVYTTASGRKSAKSLMQPALLCGKIHKIAEESADGRLIVISASAGHPEVVGIQGWCGESVVLEGEEAGESLSKRPEMENKPISLVAQTTVNRSIWNISVGLIKKGVQTSKFLIQYVKRRMSVSRRLVCLPVYPDQMIVIGDKKALTPNGSMRLAVRCAATCFLYRGCRGAYYAGARAAPEILASQQELLHRHG